MGHARIRSTPTKSKASNASSSRPAAHAKAARPRASKRRPCRTRSRRSRPKRPGRQRRSARLASAEVAGGLAEWRATTAGLPADAIDPACTEHTAPWRAGRNAIRRRVKPLARRARARPPRICARLQAGDSRGSARRAAPSGARGAAETPLRRRRCAAPAEARRRPTPAARRRASGRQGRAKEVRVLDIERRCATCAPPPSSRAAARGHAPELSRR